MTQLKSANNIAVCQVVQKQYIHMYKTNSVHGCRWYGAVNEACPSRCGPHKPQSWLRLGSSRHTAICAKDRLKCSFKRLDRVVEGDEMGSPACSWSWTSSSPPSATSFRLLQGALLRPAFLTWFVKSVCTTGPQCRLAGTQMQKKRALAATDP